MAMVQEDTRQAYKEIGKQKLADFKARRAAMAKAPDPPVDVAAAKGSEAENGGTHEHSNDHPPSMPGGAGGSPRSHAPPGASETASETAAAHQVAQLQHELSSLSSAFREAESAKEELQRHLQEVQGAHEQLHATLRQAQQEAQDQLRSAEEAASHVQEGLAEQIRLSKGRTADLHAELEGLRQLHSDTAAELGRWRDLASDLEARLGEKSKELEEASGQAQQARDWEDKYLQLQERHNTARAEFDKLKTISSERKQAVSRLQQENQELLQQIEQLGEAAASGASEGEVEARVQSAVEAVTVQAAGEAARLASELEEARQQLHSEGAAAAQLLAQLHVTQQQLEASQAVVEAAHEERSAAQSHMGDMAEQRDALKEAVQDMQEEVEKLCMSSQASLAEAQRYRAEAALVPELEALLAAARAEAAEAVALAPAAAAELESHAKEAAAQAQELQEAKARLVELEGSEQKLAELQAKLVRAKTQFDKLKATSAESKDKVVALKSEVVALTALNEQLTQQQASLSQAAEDSGSEGRAALEQELAEARVAYSHVSGQLEALTLEYEALQQRQEQLQQERGAEGAEANSRVGELEQLLADARGQASALMGLGHQQDHELALVQQQLATLSAAHDEAGAAKEELEQQLGDVQGAFDLLQMTLRQLQVESSGALVRAHEEAAERVRQLQAELAAAVASVSSGAEERVAEADGRAVEAEARATALKDKLGLAKQKFMKLQTTSQERKDQVSELQALLEQREQSSAAESARLEALVAELQVDRIQSADKANASAVAESAAAAAIAEAEVARLQAEIEGVRHTALHWEQRASELQQQQEDVQAALEQRGESDSELNILRQAYSDVSGQLGSLTQQYEALVLERGQFQEELLRREAAQSEEQALRDCVEALLSEAQGRVQQLEHELASQGNSASVFGENEVLRAQLQELEARLAEGDAMRAQQQQQPEVEPVSSHKTQLEVEPAPFPQTQPYAPAIAWGAEEGDGWESQELMLPMPTHGEADQEAVDPVQQAAIAQEAAGGSEGGEEIQQLKVQLEESELQQEELGRQVEDLEEARAAAALMAAAANQQVSELAGQLEELQQYVSRLEQQQEAVGQRAVSLEAALQEVSAAARQTEAALAEAEAKAAAAGSANIPSSEEDVIHPAQDAPDSDHLALLELRLAQAMAEGAASAAALTFTNAAVEQLQTACAAADALKEQAEDRAAEAEARAAELIGHASESVVQLRKAAAESESRLSDAHSRIEVAEVRAAELAAAAEEAETRVGDLQERLALMMAGDGDSAETAAEAAEAAVVGLRSELEASRAQLVQAAEALAAERCAVELERAGRQALQEEAEQAAAGFEAGQAEWLAERQHFLGRVEAAQGQADAARGLAAALSEEVAALKEGLHRAAGAGDDNAAARLSELAEEVEAARSESATAHAAAAQAAEQLSCVLGELEALRGQAQQAVLQVQGVQEGRRQVEERAGMLKAAMYETQQQLAEVDAGRAEALRELESLRGQAEEAGVGRERELLQAQAHVQELLAALQATSADSVPRAALVELEARCLTLEAAVGDAEGRAAVFWQVRVSDAEAVQSRLEVELHQAREELSSALEAAEEARQELEQEVALLQQELAAVRGAAEEERQRQGEEATEWQARLQAAEDERQRQGEEAAEWQRRVQAEHEEALRQALDRQSQHVGTAGGDAAVSAVTEAELVVVHQQLAEARGASEGLRQLCAQWQQEAGRLQAEVEAQQLAVAEQARASMEGHAREVQELQRQVLELQSEKAVVSSRAAAAAASPSELDALRQQMAHLDHALKSEQRRAAEYYAQLTELMLASQAGGGGGGPSSQSGKALMLSPARSPGMGKKVDDRPGLPGAAGGGAYDPESAVLQGASSTFQPLAGWLRGRGGALAVPAAAAGLLDKLTVALYRRPLARIALLIYVVFLHLAVLLF